MDYRLSGKRALVTGSNTGLGAGIARLLAAEGVAVVVHGRNAERADSVTREIVRAGGKAKSAIGDLGTDEGADSVARTAIEAFGGIDILINNAGGAAKNVPITWLDVPATVWAETYNANVISAARMVRAIVPSMKQAGWGRVINLSSYSAQASSGGIPDYASAKNAIVTLSFSLSKALAFSGITVNSISPGLMRTEATDPWLDSVSEARKIPRESVQEWVTTNMLKQTVKRMGQVEDIAYAAAFLCSPHADFITGTNLRIDGGAFPATN